MEQVVEGIGTILRALLGTAILLSPGVIFWLVIASMIVAIRWVGQKLPVKELPGDQTTQTPSTIKT